MKFASGVICGFLMIVNPNISVYGMEFTEELTNKNADPIQLNRHAGRYLMEHATLVQEGTEGHHRRLEEANKYQNQNKDYSFLNNYSVKFQGCWHKQIWNTDSYMYSNAPKVVTKRYVKFRLCPRDSCSDRKNEGCKKNYGEYVTDLNTFVDAYMAEAIENDKYSSKFSKRAELASCRKMLNSCGCIGRRWDDDWFEWDECYGNCMNRFDANYCGDYKNRLEPKNKQEADANYNGYVDADGYGDGNGNYNVKANVYDDAYFHDDYYDDDNGENMEDEEAFLYRYSRCRLWSEAGKVVQYNIDDNALTDDVGYGSGYGDDAVSQSYYPYLYIGPFCANSGSSVFMGMFTDRSCSNYADQSGGRNTYYKITGEQLPYSRTSLVKRNCVKCVDDDDGDAWYSGSQTKEICTALYDSSGKCEENFKADKSTKVYNSCNFLSKIKVTGANPLVDINDSEVAQGFIWFFFTTTLLVGMYIGYLKWKIYANKRDNPDAVYFYD